MRSVLLLLSQNSHLRRYLRGVVAHACDAVQMKGVSRTCVYPNFPQARSQYRRVFLYRLHVNSM